MTWGFEVRGYGQQHYVGNWLEQFAASLASKLDAWVEVDYQQPMVIVSVNGSERAKFLLPLAALRITQAASAGMSLAHQIEAGKALWSTIGLDHLN